MSAKYPTKLGVKTTTPFYEFTGSLPKTSPDDAHEWLPWALEQLPNGWTSNENRPRGTLHIPANGLYAKKTVIIPHRCGTQGPTSHVRQMPGLEAADDFIGEYLLETEETPGQGVFSNHVRDLSLQCRGKCNGFKVTADQQGLLFNLWISGWKSIGLNLHKVSRTLVMGLDLELDEDWKVRRGTGVRAYDSQFSWLSSTIHNANIGFDLNECEALTIDGAAFEKTDQPFRALLCRGLDIRMAHIRTALELAIETTNCWSVEFSGVFITCEREMFAIIEGEQKLLTSRGDDTGLGSLGVYSSAQEKQNDLIAGLAIEIAALKEELKRLNSTLT